jgi:hypothetical protein
MSLIERWWRIVPRPHLSTKVTWCSEDPSNRLDAAWEGAMVTEYVRADQLAGAVSAALTDAAMALREVGGKLEGPDGWYAAAHFIEARARDPLGGSRT